MVEYKSMGQDRNKRGINIQTAIWLKVDFYLKNQTLICSDFMYNYGVTEVTDRHEA